MLAETQVFFPWPNQKPLIEGQTTQWPKEKGQMDNDLQNITQKHEDLATRTPLKTGCELRSSGRVSNSRSTCGNHRITYCCQSGDKS